MLDKIIHLYNLYN